MNYTQYLEFVLQTVMGNLKLGKPQLTAAALGTLLHQSSPDVTWKSFGKRSLAELLDDPWFEGKLDKSLTEKGALAVIPVGHQATTSNHAIERFNPLRKAMWEAFVVVSPYGRRFVNRTNGTIRFGLDVAPAPADDWVEIHPIGNDVQLEWAREFSDAHAKGLGQEPDSQNWTPHTFGAMLKQENEPLAALWNRFRSSRVSQVVQQWLNENALPPECAFQKRPTVTKFESLNSSGSDFQIELSPEETRQVLVAALSSLPLEKLLDIPIPPRLIFAALSKSKMR